jgi:hypothetical protein
MSCKGRNDGLNWMLNKWFWFLMLPARHNGRGASNKTEPPAGDRQGVGRGCLSWTVAMNTRALAIITVFCLLLIFMWFTPLERQSWALERQGRVCKPRLDRVSPVELGKSVTFKWTCPAEQGTGGGYYIVFIRPSGTYVLLKVSEGRTSYEFTPDAVGQWRWLVINTDPDRTKPDVESEPGRFEATPPKNSSD